MFFCLQYGLIDENIIQKKHHYMFHYRFYVNIIIAMFSSERPLRNHHNWGDFRTILINASFCRILWYLFWPTTSSSRIGDRSSPFYLAFRMNGSNESKRVLLGTCSNNDEQWKHLDGSESKRTSLLSTTTRIRVNGKRYRPYSKDFFQIIIDTF